MLRSVNERVIGDDEIHYARSPVRVYDYVCLSDYARNKQHLGDTLKRAEMTNTAVAFSAFTSGAGSGMLSVVKPVDAELTVVSLCGTDGIRTHKLALCCFGNYAPVVHLYFRSDCS